jgi:aspartate/methionine/tyrosine aminotransferase
MRLSSRLPRDLTPTRFARAIAEHRAAGLPLIDLTDSNPTRMGLDYDADLLQPLGDPAGLAYDPEPLGLAPAREAVSTQYLRRGLEVEVPADRIALTASTSESYSLIFKTLCDPGDTVLVPRPSYPLFEHLTALEGVSAVHYDLEYHGAWRVDVDSVRRAIDARTRAVVIVSPNNPTGSRLHRDDLAALAAMAGARGLALIGDEVFEDYRLDPAPNGVSVLEQDAAPAFSLGGLSKSVGLPQVKLGWIAFANVGDDFRRAFEIAADTYLSVSTPVQLAAGSLLDRGSGIRAQIHVRLRGNLDYLRHAVSKYDAVSVLPVEGGWSAVLQVPALVPDEELVLELLKEDHVLVHPGYFFDFPREAFVVVSLILPPVPFGEGLAHLLRRASGPAA